MSSAFFILMTFESFFKILGVLQKGSLWGILGSEVNFAEKINLFYVFHLKIKIIWLKQNKAKSEGKK